MSLAVSFDCHERILAGINVLGISTLVASLANTEYNRVSLGPCEKLLRQRYHGDSLPVIDKAHDRVE